MSESKRTTRLIELALGFKNQGPDAARVFASLTASIQAFKRTHPGATFQQIAAEVNRLGGSFTRTNPLMKKFIADQQQGGSAAKQWATALGAVNSAATGLISPFSKLSSLVGGEAFGFGAGIKWVNAYQKQMLSLSAQFSKYGAGMGQLNQAIQRVGEKTGLTQKETAALFSLYEKGFPYASLQNGERLFTNIKAAVGGNIDAMQDMASMLQGIIDKFPELEDAITNVNQGGNRKLLESQSRLAFMTGKLSLAEHKRFQDYIKGGQQMSEADQAQRDGMQRQIDSMNKLRQVFEKLTQQIGETLMPAMEKVSKWVSDTYSKLEPYVPLITKIGLGLGVVLTACKAIGTAVNLWKIASNLPGISNALAMMGPGGGGAGGWGRKAIGTALSSPSFYAKGALGGAAGFAVGQGVDSLYGAATGRDLATDGSDAAVGGNIAKTGASIATGFATGGVPGAIVAAGVNILENIYKLLVVWSGKGGITEIKDDVIQLNAANAKAIDGGMAKLRDQLSKEKDPSKRADIEKTIKINELLARAGQADAKKFESDSGYLAAVGRTLSNFGSYLSPYDNMARAAGRDPIEERSGGVGTSSDGQSLREEAKRLQREQAADRQRAKEEKVSSALKDAKIKIDPAQFKELTSLLAAAEDGSGTAQSKLASFGIDAKRTGEVGKLWDADNSKEFAKMVRVAGRGITGTKAIAEETEPGITQKAAEKELATAVESISKKYLSGDLKGGAQEYRSVLQKLDKVKIDNVISGTSDRDAGTLKQFGVDTKRFAGIDGASTFQTDDPLFDQMITASQRMNDKMAEIQKQASGRQMTDDEQKKFKQLQDANAVINAQLQQRNKIQQSFAPLLAMSDAAFNEQMKSVAATNELFQAQRGLLSSIVQNAQSTGNMNLNAVNQSTAEAIRLLKEYNEGTKQQIELEQEQLKIAEQDAEAAIAKNKELIVQKRAAAKSGDGEAGKEADELERQNKLAEIRKSKGVLQQQANARILTQLQQTSTVEKQIVDILQERLELNKANVDYAAAEVSKAESLIQLYDNMGGGLRASADMRMEAAYNVGKQIDEEKKNLENIRATMAQGLPAMTEEVAKDKSFNDGTKTQSQIIEEAKKRLISLDTQRVNKETAIVNLMNKQAQMTKAVRDGYVSAITVMTAGSGMFNKILITQDKNLGSGLKNMDVLQSKTSGGIGGGKTRAGQWTTSGLDAGSNEAGYRTYDGRMSNNNNVDDIRKNALKFTQEKIAGVKSGAAAAVGSSPNAIGLIAQNGQSGVPTAPNDPNRVPTAKPPLSATPPAAPSPAKSTTLPTPSPSSAAAPTPQINLNMGGVKIEVATIQRLASLIESKINEAMSELKKQLMGRGSSVPKGA